MSSELFMLKNVFILLISNFMKIVHIELSYERGKISMPEVNWENHLLKMFNISNNKVCSFIIPRYDIFELAILNRKMITSRI
jgi:hypothetical protein